MEQGSPLSCHPLCFPACRTCAFEGLESECILELPPQRSVELSLPDPLMKYVGKSCYASVELVECPHSQNSLAKNCLHTAIPSIEVQFSCPVVQHVRRNSIDIPIWIIENHPSIVLRTEEPNQIKILVREQKLYLATPIFVWPDRRRIDNNHKVSRGRAYWDSMDVRLIRCIYLAGALNQTVHDTTQSFVIYSTEHFPFFFVLPKFRCPSFWKIQQPQPQCNMRDVLQNKTDEVIMTCPTKNWIYIYFWLQPTLKLQHVNISIISSIS